ncbi:endonuclease III [Candidatus Poribacteria bacterium]|nr:endonuclease III [Candidatus Poribacteria bacterium]MYB66288.1 endonuclease III [Candidatus Poribacteria bacterium]
MDIQQKTEFISDTLENMFGTPKRDGDRDVLDCLIETILSQNTTDVSRDKGYARLIDKFPTWEDVIEADVKAVEASIKIVGLGNQKATTIKNFLSWLKAEHGELSLEFIHDMKTEDALELLCQHKGIGIKTASVTLAFACGREVFPVDTHILRISKRLALIPQNCSADKAHTELPKIVPKGKSYPFHMNLIYFGRRICNARKPLCEQCPFTQHCLYYEENIQP